MANQNNSLSHSFNFQNNQVRVIEKDGEPWFVAVDVCNILGLDNPTKAVVNLDESELTLTFIQGKTGLRKGNIISESGLYKLIMRSNKPEAKAFQNWVTGEVLPSIRKTGSYNPQAAQAEAQQPQQEPLPLTAEDMEKVVDGLGYVLTCHSLAATTGAAVAKAVFQALMQDPEQETHNVRYVLNLTAGYGKAADEVRLTRVPQDAMVSSLDDLPKHISNIGLMDQSKMKALANLVAICSRRIAHHMA